MRVLASRPLPGEAWQKLTDVEIGSIEEGRDDVDVLVVSNEAIDPSRFPALGLVANCGVGYERIDVDACKRRGVRVTNTPGVLDDAVADHAIGLMLAVRRRLVEGHDLARTGAWSMRYASAPFLGREMTGATLGLVGRGRIGAAVARRAAAFSMRVVHYSRERSRPGWVPLEELLRSSDIVSLHVPLTPQTRGMIDAKMLGEMQDGASLINTARAQIVETDALTAELVSGRLSAGLDVFVDEPNVPEVLCRLPNVVLTPHIGSATVETRAAMTRLVVENVLAYRRGEALITPVW